MTEELELDFTRVLPPPPAHFFGRDDFVNDIISVIGEGRRLATPSSPNFVILGPGGMGKTSIALTVLHTPAIDDLFEDRKLFIGCDAISNATQLVTAVADSL